jgi:hypothetical protein
LLKSVTNTSIIKRLSNREDAFSCELSIMPAEPACIYPYWTRFAPERRQWKSNDCALPALDWRTAKLSNQKIAEVQKNAW